MQKVIMASPHAQDREPALSMTRSGLATKETKVQLYIYTNHFKVNVTNVDGYFFKYNVSMFLSIMGLSTIG